MIKLNLMEMYILLIFGHHCSNLVPALPIMSLSMGTSEEIEDAKITAEKNEDLKIEAKI